MNAKATREQWLCGPLPKAGLTEPWVFSLSFGYVIFQQRAQE